MEVGFEVSNTQVLPSVESLLPSDEDVGAPSAPSPPAQCHASHRVSDRLHLQICKQAPMKCFLFIRVKSWWVADGHGAGEVAESSTSEPTGSRKETRWA